MEIILLKKEGVSTESSILLLQLKEISGCRNSNILFS
jgi:hypothetical protein